MATSPVQLSISNLKKDALLPWPVLKEKYGLSVAQLKKAFRSAGIEKKRSTTDKFVLVDDRPTQEIISHAGHTTFEG